MKRMPILIIAAVLTIGISLAQEAPKTLTTLTTVEGQTFQRVEVLKQDPDGLMFRHSKGMAKIPFAELPEEIQTQFGYKAEAAAAFVKEHQEAEKAAKAKAAAARIESREKKMMEKAVKLQMELLRQQAAMGNGGGLVIPGFADFGVATSGYGLGFDLGFLPDHGLHPGGGHGGDKAADLARLKYQWDRDVLFGDFSTTKRIGPNAPLYNGSVTNSNVRPFATFGGYRYPTELAVRAGSPLVGRSSGRPGHRAAMAPGQYSNGYRGPSQNRFVPANSGGARVGGTGTLMQGGANRISHR